MKTFEICTQCTPHFPCLLHTNAAWNMHCIAITTYMTIIKKLDLYILKKFLLVFAGAFFVVLFVFMMQFTWRYVDELIGKGLSWDILAKFYWYMAITLVRDSLPLAILLSSLISFGNMGESFELLAMKAAGVPLIRIMRPLAIFAVFMTGTSFYFQNVASPDAQIGLKTLLFSMKQQSPAVEIPEGVFYNGVPNINIYVQKKNTLTGMLYQTIIYKTDQGFDHAQIVLADSARLEVTRDKMHLRLELWNGEQFESLESANAMNGAMNGAKKPFDRETFIFKTLLIDFDSNFNLMDKNALTGMPTAKNMKQINQSVDSMNHELDSIGKQYYKDATFTYYRTPHVSKTDSLKLVKLLTAHVKSVSFDTIVAHIAPDRLQTAKEEALANVKSVSADLEWKGINTEQEERDIRQHEVEWHNKITYSLACLLFFFVGAPLGAIIRKGGLGMPTVISVAIFIVWYIIYTSGMKMARDGNINMVLGMWISSIIIAPFGAFFTYKANKDSVVFNLDAYKAFFNRLFGLRNRRHIFRKEVIINDPREDVMRQELQLLRDECIQYNQKKHLLRAPAYSKIFFNYTPDTEVESISQRLESIVEELSNSKNRLVLAELNKLPIIFTHAHTSPFNSKRMNVLAGIVFPLGMVLWFRIWRFRLRLYKDMKTMVQVSDKLAKLLNGESITEESSTEQALEKRKLKRFHLPFFHKENMDAYATNDAETSGWAKYKKKVYAVIALLLVIAACCGGWRTYKYYQFKHYMQEHGELTPNTPKDANTEGLQMPNVKDNVKQLRLPEKSPE